MKGYAAIKTTAFRGCRSTFKQLFSTKNRTSVYCKQNCYSNTQSSSGRVAQSVTCLATDASLTADPGVPNSILAQSHTLIMK